MQQRSWPAPVGLAVLWGLSFLFLRGMVAGVGWALGALLISLVVAAAMAVVSYRGTGRLGLGGSPTQILVLGAAITAQNVGLCVALDQGGVALTAIVLGSVPLFATLTGQVWGIDRITAVGALGLGVGFLGLLLVVAFPAQGDTWAFIAGILAALIGSLAAAFGTRYASVRLGGRPQALASSSFLAALLTVPLVLIVGLRPGNVGTYLTLLLVGMVAALVGPLFGVRSSDGAPEQASVVKAGGTVVAMLAGVVVAGERLAGVQLLGMVLMIVGTLFVLDVLPTRLRVPWRD